MCECDVGYAGIGCENRLETPYGCRGGCNGRGLCGPSGECVCEPGIVGDNCDRVGLVEAPKRPPCVSPPPTTSPPPPGRASPPPPTRDTAAADDAG